MSSQVTGTITADNILRSPVPDMELPNIPFHEYVFNKCDKFKGNIAMEEYLTGRSITYADVKNCSLRVAGKLHSLGFRKGDVILTHSVNCIDKTLLLFACYTLGVIVSPANPTFTPEELLIQIKDCGAKCVVTHAAVQPVMTKALKLGNMDNIQKFVFGDAPGYQSFTTLLSGDSLPVPDVTFDPVEDILLLPYSSGTTGLPKGVMLTHRNILSALVLSGPSGLATHEDQVIMALLPMYHISGLYVFQNILLGGAKAVVLPNFDPETYLKSIQEKRITFLGMVPPLIVFTAKHPLVDAYDISSVDTVFVGAAPLGADVTNTFRERLPHVHTFNQLYGMTETSPVTNVDISQTPGCAGHMIANTLGKIVDYDTGRALGAGEAGEVWLKGPQVMKGYHNNKHATENTMEDGWIKTGDIGLYDESGKLFVTDRLKELIKYKGSQVAPAELESLLLSNPHVQDCAVIGRPDERAGELPTAFLVLKPGVQVTETDIQDYVAERVAKAKRLSGGVRFIKEVPKNASGKILRRVLRSEYL